MCGIAGYAGLHRPELLGPMCNAMAHRGPDDEGTWHDPAAEVGLGHRRLAVIDLSPAGHQPMSNADGTVWITYNGELYNFPEHRERLRRKGYPFRSQTDTEVLLALYDEQGLDFLEGLNGIFAFALWDSRQRRLLLVRDHAGIKPLYYAWNGRRLFFASEIKALLTIPDFPRQIHLPSVSDYLTFLWVPGEHTLLADVKKVEPGHCMVWQGGKLERRRWFTLDYAPDYSRSSADWVDEVHDTFLRTTRRQMVSDVPLGAFLSGGLDSSSIVACMRHSFPSRPITAYTVQFASGDMAEEQGEEDYPFAEHVARALDVDLKNVRLCPNAIELLPRMVYYLDEPDADPAVFPSYLISKLAREDGTTVLLSGTGGDEVFFGYRSHLAYRLYERFRWLESRSGSVALALATRLASATLGAQALLTRRLVKFTRGVGKTGLERHLALSDWSTEPIRRGLLAPDVAKAKNDGIPECLRRYGTDFCGDGAINLHSHLLIQTFLAAHNFLYTDKSSMAVSLETRVPFMDVELMRLAARIPEGFKLRGRTTKWVLKEAMRRHLPDQLLSRKKAGFGAPLRQWLRNDLKGVIGDVLSPSQVKARGLFEPAAVHRVLQDNAAGTRDHAYLIYALLTMEVWMQTFLDRPAQEISL